MRGGPGGEGLDVEGVIDRLLEVRGCRPGKQVNLREWEIRELCLRAREVFLEQPILLELEAPIKICGDVHGQYYDLLRIFEYGEYPPLANYLFLGDYVDRGNQSLETICLLLAYKIKYPENFFLLRGNHECASINRIYGFYDEVKRRYDLRLWKTFTDCFNCLPVAAIIDDKIFCMHGGLSPELDDLKKIAKIMRPTDVPDTGLLCDLLWSDPDKEISGWGDNDRGVSFTFSSDVVDTFLKKQRFDLICRAHQEVRGRPTFLFPWGFHPRAWRVMSVGFFLRVWPIHLHLRLDICCAIGSCLVWRHSSVLLIWSGHRILIICRRHLLMKV